jgi:hypothetical protein
MDVYSVLVLRLVQRQGGCAMFNHYQPRWLYETLPYLYVGSGVVSLTTLEHLLSTFSGLLLVSAGVVVWKLRHDHRRWHTEQHQRSTPRRKTKLPT